MSENSAKNKAPNNIYLLLDNELDRMHELLKVYLTLPQEPSQYNMRQNTYNASASQIGTIYKRILDMQNILMKSFGEHENIIQEKIAELALTGDDT